MTATPDGAIMRRDLAAASLVASALLGTLFVALQPALPADHAARLAAIEAAGPRGAVSAVAFVLQQLPFAVAVLGLGHLLRPRTPRLATAGVLLGCLGAFGHTVYGGMSMVYLVMAGDPARSAPYTTLYRRLDSSPVMLFSLIGLTGTVLGLIVLALAMFRSGLVPRWVPGLILAFVVLEFAGSAVSSSASYVAGGCLVIAFATLAARLHRMPARAWAAPAYVEEPGPVLV